MVCEIIYFDFMKLNENRICSGKHTEFVKYN
jgi:hypothetical protein